MKPDEIQVELAKLEIIRELVDFYFFPWGAGKAAMWEAMDGDGVCFSGERVLQLVKKALDD